MSGKKKNGHKKPTTTEIVLLVTAIIQLVIAVIELISRLTS